MDEVQGRAVSVSKEASGYDAADGLGGEAGADEDGFDLAECVSGHGDLRVRPGRD